MNMNQAPAPILSPDSLKALAEQFGDEALEAIRSGDEVVARVLAQNAACYALDIVGRVESKHSPAWDRRPRR
jgi:hypothetical protein